MAFIKSLSEQRDIVADVDPTTLTGEEADALATANPKGYAAMIALRIGRDLFRRGEFTTKAASAVIDVLKDAPHRAQAAKPSETPSEAPEGMHRIADRIYKVQRSQESGRVYAKELVKVSEPATFAGVRVTGEYTHKFEFQYAAGAVRRLSEATLMTLEEAKEFGALYGTCCVCGRTLTNEESIEAGIGPVCAGRFAA